MSHIELRHLVSGHFSRILHGDAYGQLVVYKFPRQSLVFGPTQIVNRMNQDTEISRQISLWDQRGSEVIRGNLLVIPIEESLIGAPVEDAERPIEVLRIVHSFDP